MGNKGQKDTERKVVKMIIVDDMLEEGCIHHAQVPISGAKLSKHANNVIVILK